MTEDEMRDYVGATSLCFLSLDGMIKATGHPKEVFSNSHFDGIYPISIGAREDEIKHLKPGETLPKAGHKPTRLATTRTPSV
jgi:glutamine phosphoribosylpyrophosphate amidotransferase